MKIVEGDWGIANCFDDYIEVNKNLKEYPKLYDWVMAHELKHVHSPNITWYDVEHDLRESFSFKDIGKVFKIWIFMIQYPKSLIQLSFVQIRNKRVYWDMSLMLIYLILIIAIIVVVKIWQTLA